ncbi:MAG: hypothetical protein NE334_12495 [Lentisphaeraceae bacterium]|nr:hypothetical protein [Lentisphaeraceae bacterium]
MFSKINSELSKHAKGFQIVLGLMIVVPFVFMVPDADIFGPGYQDTTPKTVGTISGKDISWEEYEKEVKLFISTQSMTNYNFIGLLRQGPEVLYNEGLRPAVLDYMARWKEVKKQIDSGKLEAAVKRKDIKELVEGKFATTLQIAKMMTRNQFQLDAKQTIELLRVNFGIGGGLFDEAMDRVILTDRFETQLKEKVEVKEEDVLARIKKDEKVFNVRTAEINADTYKNEPLNEYYEKNKDKFFDKEAVKASLIVFDPQQYKADILKTDLTKEVEKAFADEKKTNDQAEKNAAQIKERLKDRIAQNKAKEKAKQMATLIESNLKAKVKKESKTEDILKIFTSLATASKLNIQESSYHNNKNVETGDHPINAKVTEAILSLSSDNPIKLLDDQSKIYLFVFNSKGYYQPIEKVRSDLLAAVYKDKASTYYNNNIEDFKLQHRVTAGYITIYGGLFQSEVTVSAEEAKKVYESDASYQTPQRKLLQFAYELKADAKDEDKKAAVKAIEDFTKTNAGKSEVELLKLDLGKDSKIKLTNLSWVKENDLRTGTDKEIVTEAFKTKDGQFTKAFERDKFVATVFVAGNRAFTPYEEVQQRITGSLRTQLLKDITTKKADELHRKLSTLKEPTKEKVAAAISEFSEKYNITTRKVEDLPAAETLNNQFAQQMVDSIAKRNGITPTLVLDLTSLSNDRLFTRVRSMPNLSKVIGYLVEDKPAAYEPLEKAEDTIFERLNNSDAQKIASEKVIEIKKELEESVKKEEDFKAAMSKYGFKEAKDVKFKEADPTILKVLEEDPKAKEFGTNTDPSGSVTTIVYVADVKEVSEEDINKVKAEVEKTVRTEKQNEALTEFWTEALKTYDVKAVTSTAKES